MPEAGCWKKREDDRPVSTPKKKRVTVARPAQTPPSPTTARFSAPLGVGKVITHAAGAEQGAGPSRTTPPRPRGAPPRAPRSYLGGREGGGGAGGGRRAAGTRLLLLGRVVQQNFAALVELPHGGRGGGGSRLSSSRQRWGRGGSGRCLRSPGRGGSAGLGAAGLSPRRGLPEREGGAVPGAAGSPPPATASPAGLLAAPARRAADPAPTPRLAAAGSRLGGRAPRRQGGQGAGATPPAAPLLTCHLSPPEPRPAAAAPPLPCLRGRGRGAGGAFPSPRQPAPRRPLSDSAGPGDGGRHPRAGMSPSQPPAGTGGALGDKGAGRCWGACGWRCPRSGDHKMCVRATRGTLRQGRTVALRVMAPRRCHTRPWHHLGGSRCTHPCTRRPLAPTISQGSPQESLPPCPQPCPAAMPSSLGSAPPRSFPPPSPHRAPWPGQKRLVHPAGVQWVPVAPSLMAEWPSLDVTPYIPAGTFKGSCFQIDVLACFAIKICT